MLVPDSIGFNPRAREGRDSGVLHTLAAVYIVSIHAPAKGATPLSFLI